MANWVEQMLHVVGRKADIDRFIKTGLRRRSRTQFDDLLDLHALCPLKRREPKDLYTHPRAIVLSRYRTRTQACFALTTAWDYPARFYARLPAHWPTLGFACTVNEDMGSFGGIIVAMEGEVTNLVEDYGADGYSRRRQARRIREALERWRQPLADGRDWRLFAITPWRNASMPFDAHFDDDFWFYFRTREEAAAFRERYGGRSPLRRVDGEWRRTRF